MTMTMFNWAVYSVTRKKRLAFIWIHRGGLFRKICVTFPSRLVVHDESSAFRLSPLSRQAMNAVAAKIMAPPSQV